MPSFTWYNRCVYGYSEPTACIISFAAQFAYAYKGLTCNGRVDRPDLADLHTDLEVSVPVGVRDRFDGNEDAVLQVCILCTATVEAVRHR